METVLPSKNLETNKGGDFPDGPVVKIPCFCSGVTGLIPDETAGTKTKLMRELVQVE